jgi:hypothetical protein
LNIYCCRKPINERLLRHSARKGDDHRLKLPINVHIHQPQSIKNGNVENSGQQYSKIPSTSLKETIDL